MYYPHNKNELMSNPLDGIFSLCNSPYNLIAGKCDLSNGIGWAINGVLVPELPYMQPQHYAELFPVRALNGDPSLDLFGLWYSLAYDKLSQYDESDFGTKFQIFNLKDWGSGIAIYAYDPDSDDDACVFVSLPGATLKQYISTFNSVLGNVEDVEDAKELLEAFSNKGAKVQVCPSDSIESLFPMPEWFAPYADDAGWIGTCGVSPDISWHNLLALRELLGATEQLQPEVVATFFCDGEDLNSIGALQEFLGFPRRIRYEDNSGWVLN